MKKRSISSHKIIIIIKILKKCQKKFVNNNQHSINKEAKIFRND